MHDILIKNGKVVDGSKAKGTVTDIAINDGKITEIGDLTGDGAHRVIDAHGLIVAPGFIDISNRSDTRWRLFKDPYMESLLYQGITTIIGGNSGSSLAPIYNEDMLNAVRKWIDVGEVNIGWQSMEDFLRVIEDRHLSVNFGTFVGYGTLRRGLLGDESRELNKNEKTSMKKHIAESLRRGALGVSTGLIYSHERDIKTSELIDVARVVAKHKKLYVAHLRNEGEKLRDAVDEALHIHKKSHARVHISHLKAMEKEHWMQMKDAIKNIEKTDVVFDIYPYTFSTTVLYTLLPSWVSDGGRRMMLERLRSKNLRKRIVMEMDSGINLATAIVAHTMRSDYFCGKTFAQIAKSQNTSVNDAVIDVLLASDGQVNVFLESISEENIKRGLRSAHAVVSSNGVGYTIQTRNNCLEHPRSFGAFPRVFAQYVRNDSILTIEEFVHKSTGKIAEEIGLKDRGFIRQNAFADIVIFDEKKFHDRATVDRPYQYATGVKYLIVNGQIAIKYGKYTGIRAGVIIKG